MKITFLGTSHGVPGEDRYCSSALVECGDNAYLIDGGAPVADLLIRYGVPYEKLKAVFTTHIHSDHTIGLLHLMSLSSWKFKESSYDLYLTEQAGIEAFRTVVEVTDGYFDGDRIRLRLTAPGTFYDDGTLTVTAVPTRHLEAGGQPSYALILESEGKRVIFTGDLHHGDAADFPAPAKEEPSDLIICEMAHFGHEVILPIVTACPTGKVLFNHVWYHYEESMAAIRAADGQYPMPVLAVEDGDVFEI